MNPGPTLGFYAVVAAYAVVLGAILVFVTMMAGRQKKLERRKKELKNLTNS